MCNVPGEGHSRKLAPKYSGPMIITEVLGNDRYRVEDLPSSTRSRSKKYKNVVAIDRMKPWIDAVALSDASEEGSGDDGVPTPQEDD